jgi:FkbM family methyltransferase
MIIGSNLLGLAKRLLTRVLGLIGFHRLLLRWRAWEAAAHSEREIRLLRYLVDPQRIAIDIGAAEGIYALRLQQLARKCIAFEPNPSSYLALKRVLPEVESVQAAVSACDGDAVLRIPVVNGIPYTGWGTVEPKNRLAELPTHDLQEIKVRTVCPDNMGLGDIGFIKIDVEGHELDVLAGLSGLITRCRPNLVIEVGDAQRGGSFAEIRNRLEPLGYIAMRLDDNGLLRVVPTDIDIKHAMNMIFISMNDVALGSN